MGKKTQQSVGPEGAKATLEVVMRHLVYSVILSSATLCTAVAACTFEIPPIARAVSDHTRIVVGVVESVTGDSVSQEGVPTVLVPEEATFRVERTLKGEAGPPSFRLVFDPDLAYPRNACGGLFLVYTTGSRLLLMLDEPVADDVYRAPSVGPWRLRLSPDDDYPEALLYKYVEAVVALGRPPIGIDFVGPGEQRTGMPLNLRVTVTNELSTVLRVMINGPPEQESAFTLWLRVAGVVPRHTGSQPVPPATFEVPPGGVRSIELGEYLEVSEVGRQKVNGWLWMPTGASELAFPPESSMYGDILFGLWSFISDIGTGVEEGTWGTAKKVGLGQQ